MVNIKFLLILLILSAKLAVSQEVVIVKLRTPVKTHDARFDPYYDLGCEACFGATGCHSRNIMNPKKVHKNLLGRRAAFVQQGFDLKTKVSQQRLVFLTPLIGEANIQIITLENSSQRAVLKWDGNKYRALKFEYAPVLVSNDNVNGLKEFNSISSESNRPTNVAGFGSLFRSRIKPLNKKLGDQLIQSWEQAIQEAQSQDGFADYYYETLCSKPKAIDQDRTASLLSFCTTGDKP